MKNQSVLWKILGTRLSQTGHRSNKTHVAMCISVQMRRYLSQHWICFSDHASSYFWQSSNFTFRTTVKLTFYKPKQRWMSFKANNEHMNERTKQCLHWVCYLTWVFRVSIYSSIATYFMSANNLVNNPSEHMWAIETTSLCWGWQPARRVDGIE